MTNKIYETIDKVVGYAGKAVEPLKKVAKTGLVAAATSAAALSGLGCAEAVNKPTDTKEPTPVVKVVDKEAPTIGVGIEPRYGYVAKMDVPYELIVPVNDNSGGKVDVSYKLGGYESPTQTVKSGEKAVFGDGVSRLPGEWELGDQYIGITLTDEAGNSKTVEHLVTIHSTNAAILCPELPNLLKPVDDLCPKEGDD